MMNPAKHNRAAIVLIALCVLAAVLAVFAVTALLGRGRLEEPIELAMMTEETAASSGDSNTIRPSSGGDANAPSAPGAPKEQYAEDAPEAAVPEADAWAAYPTSLRSQGNVSAAGEYVYWSIDRRIWRMPREGGEPKLVLETEKLSQYGVDAGYDTFVSVSFTAIGDWIYLSVNVDEGERDAFFRLPAEGGEPEFLFLGRDDMLQTDGETLYIMSELYNDGWGVYLLSYNTATGEFNPTELLEEITEERTIERSFTRYAIRDGVLCYHRQPISYEDYRVIKTYDLSTKELRTVYEHSGAEGQYDYWPFIAGDTVYACRMLNEDTGYTAVCKRDLNTGETEILAGGVFNKPGNGSPENNNPPSGYGTLAMPLAGRLFYTTAYDDATGEYTYSLAPLGDEHTILGTLTTTERIGRTYGPWAFLTGGVLDGRTGEIIKAEDTSPLFTLEDVLPSYEQARAFGAENPQFRARWDTPWLSPND